MCCSGLKNSAGWTCDSIATVRLPPVLLPPVELATESQICKKKLRYIFFKNWKINNIKIKKIRLCAADNFGALRLVGPLTCGLHHHPPAAFGPRAHARPTRVASCPTSFAFICSYTASNGQYIYTIAAVPGSFMATLANGWDQQLNIVSRDPFLFMIFLWFTVIFQRFSQNKK